jgi:hypothetical protein
VRLMYAPYDIGDVGGGQKAVNVVLPLPARYADNPSWSVTNFPAIIPDANHKTTVHVPIVQKEYDDQRAARLVAEIGAAIAKTNQAMTNNFTAVTARHNQEEAMKNDPRAAVVGAMGGVDPSQYTAEVLADRAAQSPTAIILGNDGQVITPTQHIELDAWEKFYNQTGVRLPTPEGVGRDISNGLKDLLKGVGLPDLSNVAIIAIVVGGVVVFATLKSAVR